MNQPSDIDQLRDLFLNAPESDTTRILAVVGSLLAGPPPARDDAAEIVEWFVDNESALQLGAFLTGIGVIGFVWWFGTLWRAMRRGSSGSPRLEVVALAGFLFSGAMAFSGFSVIAGTASGIDDVGDFSSFFFGLASVFYGFAGIGTAIMVMAISGVAFRTAFLPKWVAQTGLVVVAANLLSGVAVASDAAVWGQIGFIAFLAWALWTVAVSVHMFQNVPADA